MKVYLSGEGPTELGCWFKELPYRERPPEVGVIEALLHQAGQARRKRPVVAIVTGRCPRA